MRALLTAALILNATAALAEPKSITADIWVDNWFEMYVNGEKLIEDSVPITTERSFNAETTTFTSDLPMTIAIMAKDFKENDSGLEYIGTNRQQMGDGGMIAQFHDTATGALIAATDSTMRCVVVQHAPVDRACAKESNPVAGQGACGFVDTPIPANWTAPDFDDSAWPAAVEHSAREVGPKDGYDEVSWDKSAKLIWSDDLVLDNTLLCRLVVTECLRTKSRTTHQEARCETLVFRPCVERYQSLSNIQMVVEVTALASQPPLAAVVRFGRLGAKPTCGDAAHDRFDISPAPEFAAYGVEKGGD